MIKKIKNFVTKNILIELHYKFSFITQIFSLLITLLVFFFIDSFFKSEVQKYIELNINYFSYVFVSFIIFNYSGGNSTISQKINFDITSQTFEFILNQKQIIIPYLTSLWVYSFIISTLEASSYILISYFLGIIKPNLNFISLIILIIISSLVFSTISFISSSFIIMFKKGDVFAFIFAVFESIFAGVYFPTEILGIFSKISDFLPLTHSIKAAQKIFYENADIFELKEFYILLTFLTVLLPLSIYIFKKSVYIARKFGNLNQY